MKCPNKRQCEWKYFCLFHHFQINIVLPRKNSFQLNHIFHWGQTCAFVLLGCFHTPTICSSWGSPPGPCFCSSFSLVLLCAGWALHPEQAAWARGSCGWERSSPTRVQCSNCLTCNFAQPSPQNWLAPCSLNHCSHQQPHSLRHRWIWCLVFWLWMEQKSLNVLGTVCWWSWSLGRVSKLT